MIDWLSSVVIVTIGRIIKPHLSLLLSYGYFMMMIAVLIHLYTKQAVAQMRRHNNVAPRLPAVVHNVDMPENHNNLDISRRLALNVHLHVNLPGPAPAPAPVPAPVSSRRSTLPLVFFPLRLYRHHSFYHHPSYPPSSSLSSSSICLFLWWAGSGGAPPTQPLLEEGPNADLILRCWAIYRPISLPIALLSQCY